MTFPAILVDEMADNRVVENNRITSPHIQGKIQMAENLTDKNKQHPALAEMGIIRPSEISHYSLRQDGADKDVLRIIYNRAKGSLLPYSRKYKFGRAQKTVLADGGSSRMAHTYEISPFLLKAVSELDENQQTRHEQVFNRRSEV